MAEKPRRTRVWKLVALAATICLCAAAGLTAGLLANAFASDAPSLVHHAAAADEGPTPEQIQATAKRLRERSLRRGHGTLVAVARGTTVALHARAGGRIERRLGSLPFSYGSPPVFLVERRSGGWLHVELPTRPNHSTAWIRESAVILQRTNYRVRIDLGSHRLTAWHGSKRLLRAPIGVGKSVTPTPAGRYFIVYLIRPTDEFFGPYAFGLSAYSNVLTSFAGGDGEIGLHGTSRPDLLGSSVSHGCIRVGNGVIARLAKTLPVGTPVTIAR